MIAVIGAGPSGLAMARNLDRFQIPFVGFELHDDVGGLWDIRNPHSTVYESAHLISSKRMTEFKEFPMPERVADYPSHHEMAEYFRDYATHFGLRRHFRFGANVRSIERERDGWWLTYTQAGETHREHFTGVVIANGTLNEPNLPKLPGEFTGELHHSSAYKNAELLRDKRVLIIGCGNSGADIAVEGVHHAKSVDISLRRGYYFLPKFVAGKPIDTLGGRMKLPRPLKQRVDAVVIRALVGKPSDYGLPDPDYRLYESHPVMNTLILHHIGQGDIAPRGPIRTVHERTVTFEDGEQHEYDLILLATGYRLHYPFIDRAHLNWPPSAGAPQLYLNIFHPEYNDLFLIGMVEAAGLGWEGRHLQAEIIARYLSEKNKGTSAAAALDQRKRDEVGKPIDGGYDYLALERMAYYVHKESYLAAMARELERLTSE